MTDKWPFSDFTKQCNPIIPIIRCWRVEAWRPLRGPLRGPAVILDFQSLQLKQDCWLCGSMTKCQTHTFKKLHDLGGDISQQRAVRCLLVRPVAFSLWPAGCKGLWMSVQSKKLLAKAKPVGQPYAFCTGEIPAAPEKSLGAYNRWQLLDLLKLPRCCSLFLLPPSPPPTGDSNNCFKALAFRFIYTIYAKLWLPLFLNFDFFT